MNMIKLVLFLLICMVVLMVDARRSSPHLPSIANGLINAASDIHSPEDIEFHPARWTLIASSFSLLFISFLYLHFRRTFLNSIIHAAVPGAHRVASSSSSSPSSDVPRPSVLSRSPRNRAPRQSAGSGCGIGYRPDGVAVREIHLHHHHPQSIHLHSPQNVCTDNDCFISQMACGDQQVDPATYTGDITSCQVLEVQCGSSYTRSLETDGCTPITVPVLTYYLRNNDIISDVLQRRYRFCVTSCEFIIMCC